MNNETFQTGDINLAAALMACGVPLTPEDPAVMIQPEHGRRYASFRLLGMTMDGRDETRTMMAEWNRRGALQPGHPFTAIADFITEKRRAEPDAKSCNDFLAFAIDYLRADGFSCGTVCKVADIPDFVNGGPGTVDRYILAFIHCREVLFGIISDARRTDFHMERDGRHALISDNLPRWQKQHLTSRLNG
jgi:hypothetical protein